MRESREFAEAFAEAVPRRTAKRIAEAAPVVVEERKIEVYEEGSMDFDEAVKKVSDSLLKLFDSQFRAKPSALLAGAVIPVAAELPEEEGGIEDGEIMEIIEEEDADQL